MAEYIVEIMVNASGQGPDGLHFLQFPDLSFVHKIQSYFHEASGSIKLAASAAGGGAEILRELEGNRKDLDNQ